MAVPDIVKELVERFDRNIDSYKSGTYKETQVRREFIDPFFEALGWDVSNRLGYAEAYKDVVHEYSQKTNNSLEAPDYCFRVGGTRKFFVEAKKPSVNLKEDISPAFQLRRYAWSAKLPLSILTDFEELAIYDCRFVPKKNDKTSIARVKFVHYKDYIEEWDELYSVFSKDAVLRGSFDKYYSGSKNKKGTSEVDSTFLHEIENWRSLLAKNLALRNPELNVRDLNYAVQKTIDRIIFLRICEDRGIETYGQLLDVQSSSQIYPKLCQIYRRADEKYNSGLFHFADDKDRQDFADELTLALNVDDKVLKEIIKNLYYPDCPFEFSVFPAEILGQVYEQFLGKVIRLTGAHHAVIEDKPEVKKAGGVFYTPTYIVDYIVQNTVGEAVKDKTPKEVSELKILDPASGSGSFLLGAYQYLLNWHRDFYQEAIYNGKARPERTPLYQNSRGEWQLSTAERKRILLNNIYGVDIDPQAVEVTKLSLLLKVLEGESDETLNEQMRMFNERALPDLSSNIKCGNSLAAPDYYDQATLAFDDLEQRAAVNVFDWYEEFPFLKAVKPANNNTPATGFDVIIGNPPYVRQELLGTEMKEYLAGHYEVYNGVADLYSYFIEKGIKLLKPGGFFSYIVANKWIRANYGKTLRQWLKKQPISRIIDFGDLPVFKSATTYPCIMEIGIPKSEGTFEFCEVQSLEFADLNEYVEENKKLVRMASLEDGGWTFADSSTQELLQKIYSNGIPLSKYVNNRIYYGLKTGLNEAFVIDDETKNLLIAEDSRSAELIKPFIAGKDVKRYSTIDVQQHLIFIPKGWTRLNSSSARNPWGWLEQNYPAVARHLKPFEQKAKIRFDQGEFWWELRACDYYDAFEMSKVIYPNICKRNEFTYDSNRLYTNQKCFIIPTEDKYLLGVLNSELVNFLFKSILPKLRGGFYEPGYVFLKDFPIHKINPNDPVEAGAEQRVIQLVDLRLSLQCRLEFSKSSDEKTRIEREIKLIDSQIDRIIFSLYGLNEDEVEIITGA